MQLTSGCRAAGLPGCRAAGLPVRLPHTQEHDDKRLAEVFTTSMMENASILAASAILSFGGVAMTAATPPNHALIWMNAGLQVWCACGLQCGGRGRAVVG